MRTSVTIVGGGVIGLSLAWELSQRGVEVHLFERHRIGDSTSRVAAGILPPANLARASDPIDQLRGLSHSLFPEWSNRLLEQTGIDMGLRRCGGHYLGVSRGERAVMEGMVAYWNEQEIECEQISIDRLRSGEPEISLLVAQKEGVAAWWVPDEYQVRPPEYLRALHAACLRAGVKITENAPVSEIQSDPASASVCLSEHHVVGSDAVVVCGGSWAGTLLESYQLSRSVIPVRGQILVLKTPRPLVQSVINVGNRYVLCRDDGHTIIGSCEEETGFDCRTTDVMIDALRDFAVELVPKLDHAQTVGSSAGLRPLTFDGFPMIGRIPNTPNLYLAAGHYRSGIHLSPGTAVCMADLITGKVPAVDLGPFQVGNQQSTSS
ncbi:glycine oxidase ThiO [Novipirellula artificiosorum]|uniref:Hydrogen cyanide synthase subunit HcnC n=1 Tax=Novipirellula artificiosorum TaxID=2528016 RepID=A0A5C6D2X0_9BACT|nr:glycine oxidase ThiO [Novipirellula artificiosorum]TWU31533.1 Hydrogen cyanide synthase subunit HcnC precursor [Novipirellula artificiosorum]